MIIIRMGEQVSVFLAFGAGLLSFVSPCVLPLIPSYLCVIGGSPLSNEKRPQLVAQTVSFVLGFSAVFMVLSIIFSATFTLMGNAFRYINIISGAVVIVLGLNIILNFVSVLNYEKRFQFKNSPRGIIGAFVMGGAFGAGWTPCVGPALGSILLLAANGGGIPRAVLYLAFFSAGLGLPFILASFCCNAFVKVSAKIRAHLPLIQRISGALLIVIGVMIMTGRYRAFSAAAARLSGTTPAAEADTPSPGIILTGTTIADNTVPKEIVNAFRKAGIPVVSEGIDPIDFTLPLLDGTNLRLSELKGKTVFLNFWATWCGPCRAEMPSMEAVYQTLKDRGLEIVAVNLGESKDTVSAFMREHRLTFPAALDEKSVTGSWYGVQAIPTTYIIDRRGLIIARLTGSIDWNTPQIISALESTLRY